MGANYTNEDTDDFDKLIANAYQKDFTLIINQDSISETIGYTTQLQAIVKRNNTIVDLPIIWNSSDENVCTVDETGVLKCVNIGNAIITAKMVDNEQAYDTLEIEVSQTPVDDYDVRITPINYEYTNAIMQGDEVTYECYLYKNNIKQNNEFTFSLVTKAPVKNYKFEILNANSFRIKNIKKSENLDVICKSDNNIVYELNIELKGAF